MIDGLDGLAAGTAVVISAALAAMAITQGNYWLLGIALIMLGAVTGFLPYSLHRAKIFMGDAGSMFLGYFLTAAYLFAITQPFSVSLVLRRCGNIFKGDQGHIHHVLLQMGLSVPVVVLILCLANLFFAVLGVLLSVRMDSSVVLVLGVFSIAGVVFLFRVLSRSSRQRNVNYYHR